MTRGVNRFKGLYMTFEEMHKIDSRVKPLEDVKKLVQQHNKVIKRCY